MPEKLDRSSAYQRDFKLEKSDRLKFWLKKALWFVPIAYGANFLYAYHSGGAGGTFGDTFGAANALFSGFALMMLIYAIILQREELEIVKKERNDTKKLLEGQEGINRMQEGALRKQSFEQSFFSLLNLISEEKRLLDTPIKPNAAISKKYYARDSSKNSLDEALLKRKSDFDQSSINNYVADCGTVCRLFTTAYYLLDDVDFLSRTQTVHYASALHALLDAEIAHVWLFLSLVWRDDPRSGKAFFELQGLGFVEQKYKDPATRELEVLLNEYDRIEASKP